MCIDICSSHSMGREYQRTGCTIVFTALSSILVSFIATRLAGHITSRTAYLNAMAEGDFTIEVEGASLERKDEVGIMTRAFMAMHKQFPNCQRQSQRQLQRLHREQASRRMSW